MHEELRAVRERVRPLDVLSRDSLDATSGVMDNYNIDYMLDIFGEIKYSVKVEIRYSGMKVNVWANLF